MKLLFVLLVATTTALQAQDSTRYRLEVTTLAGSLRTTDRPLGGVLLGQQFAFFPTRRVGVAVGFGWGEQNAPAPLSRTDVAGLAGIYQRETMYTEASLLLRPLDTRRHALTLSAGIASVGQTATFVDSVYTLPNRPANELSLRVANISRQTAGAVLGATYLFRVSRRVGVGVSGRLLWGPDGQRVSSVGLAGTYRFNVSAASLGFSSFATDERQWGIRAAVNLSAPFERNPATVWLPRPALGLWLQLPLSVNWNLRGELSVVGRGTEQQATSVGPSTYPDRITQTSYLDATLLFSNDISEHWQAFIGPNLGFSLSGERIYDGFREVPASVINSGLVLGTSVRIGQRLALEARYVRDIIRFSREPYNGYQGFQFGTSVRLGRR
jgi:hypothetical protein